MLAFALSLLLTTVACQPPLYPIDPADVGDVLDPDGDLKSGDRSDGDSGTDDSKDEDGADEALSEGDSEDGDPHDEVETPCPESDEPIEVHFSHPGGFHPEGLNVALLPSRPQVSAIRYTLDGSEPTATSPVYNHPISVNSRKGTPNDISEIPTSKSEANAYRWRAPEGEVSKGTVIRARAWDCNDVPGPVTTSTWFVGGGLAERYPLPVVSLATNRDNLFDFETGIYVPGTHFEEGNLWSGNFYTFEGRDAERPMHFELFEEGGIPALSFDAGVRIHGNFSRQLPQKSFRFYMREEYGTSRLDYPLFPDKPVTSFKRFMLRNAGNDWGMLHFRDALAQRLIAPIRLDRQHHRTVLVFINGEYWGIQRLRDRQDDHHFANHYGLKTNDVVIIKNFQVGEGSPEDLSKYRQFLEQVEQAGATNAEVYRRISREFDLQNFIDYHASQIFLGHDDWPQNNTAMWRKRITPEIGAPYGHDGRWRWAIFDLDLALPRGRFQIPHDTLAHALDPIWGTRNVLLRELVDNDDFRERFALRFADHMNQTFTVSRMLEGIDEFVNETEPVIEEHRQRWGRPESLETWQWEVDLLQEFAHERAEHVREHISTHLNLEDWHSLSVSHTGSGTGLVRINDHLTLEHATLPWSGSYPGELPVRLRAHPLPGSCFAGWEGADHPSPLLVLKLDRATTATAKFLPIGDVGCLSEPVPHFLSASSFIFDEWSDLEPAGVLPPSMSIPMTLVNDPGLETEETDCVYSGGYGNDSRTRVRGLGEWGLSLVNTGNTDHCGWLDSVVLSLDTTDVSDVHVAFTAGTIRQNSREYALRLQYRIGRDGQFADVSAPQGGPVEYRAGDDGDEQRFEGIVLPAVVNNRSEVQLRWKYYFTGKRRSDDSGARSQIRLDDVVVSAGGGMEQR